MENKPLLSICIPTYNRAGILEVTLKRIVNQIAELENKDLVSLFISDNASTDNTREIVQRFVNPDIHIEYHCNERNLGPDRNFLKCFQAVRGKYVWLLSDDDPVSRGAIPYLLNIIKEDDYGLIHFVMDSSQKSGFEVYSNVNVFLASVSYWITFISANVFQSEDVSKVNVNDKLLHSYLMQIPFFIESAIAHDKSVMIYDKMLEEPLYNTNGGYNFFKVFVDNQFNLWHQFVRKGSITHKCFEEVKKNTCRKYIKFHIAELLILRRQLKKKNEKKGLRGGYYIDGAWHILFKWYGRQLYFYFYILKAIWLSVKRINKRILRILFKGK